MYPDVSNMATLLERVPNLRVIIRSKDKDGFFRGSIERVNEDGTFEEIDTGYGSRFYDFLEELDLCALSKIPPNPS